jgi:hypothetical protein
MQIIKSVLNCLFSMIQEAQPVTFIQRWSITEAKKQQEITSAFIVAQKDTGHISVPGNPGFQQENHTVRLLT